MKITKLISIPLISVVILLSGCAEVGTPYEATQAPSAPIEYNYIGNINSYKFHRPSCDKLPNEENSVYFESSDEALLRGFIPCKRCKP